MAEYYNGAAIYKRGGIVFHSIMDIKFSDGLILYVFPGRISPNDIWIKYRDTKIPRSNIRTPKHIHWVLDILVKREHDKEKITDFLNIMLQRWNEIKPLKERNYHSILSNLQYSRDKEFLYKFESLNRYGFWKMEFITHLIELLMLQEKTNNPNAYMFRKVIEAIQYGNDPYIIVSTATMRGGR